MQNPWRQLGSRVVYENAWLKLREDRVRRPDGQEGIYSVLLTGPSVIIVPVESDGQIHLIGQWRYPTDCFSWELPGGSTDGEDPLHAAQRELKEETGLTASDWQAVAVLQGYNGVATDMLHVFLARGLTQEETAAEDDEAITHRRTLSLEEFWAEVKEGKVTETQTISAVAAATSFLE